ncbi:LOW QUALITY PROTEIN: large ribosomal subunit protein uL2m-like [Diadema antillarum]|uniref:large ribosomal subunit protein uL2m-like n=1 Tax=Diadema antillarum TaxID=105358 RepID=UPI003A8B0358
MTSAATLTRLCKAFKSLALLGSTRGQASTLCTSHASLLPSSSSLLPQKSLLQNLSVRALSLKTPSIVDRPSHRDLHTSLPLERFRPWKNTPEYTIRPLGKKRITNRNHTGRITGGRRGGGAKRRYRMIDFHRVGPTEGPPMEEKVLSILYDPNRTADIALVAGGNRKRYILATANMEPGDIIKTSAHIGRMTVVANEGDAYPLGALAIGSLVHCVELFPGKGAERVRAGGTSAQILRKVGGQVILQLPSKLQISVSERCMATVGRVSGDQHNRMFIGKAGRSRWFGRRPSSGLWKRKGGWAGRKIKPLPPIKVYMDPNKKGTHISV